MQLESRAGMVPVLVPVWKSFVDEINPYSTPKYTKLQATLKFRLILKDVKYIIPMNTFFENILTDNLTGRRSCDLAKEMKDAHNKVKTFVAISVLCFAIFVLYPMHAYIT